MNPISASGGVVAPVKATQTEKSVSVMKATYSSTAVAAKNAETDDVVTISKSMEKLLDGFTGAGKKTPSNDDGAVGGQSGSGGGASAGGAGGGFSSAALDRAREGKKIMDNLANFQDDFANNLGKALNALKGSLGDTLGQFGMSQDDIESVLTGFSKDAEEKLKSFDFAELSVDYQKSATQFSIESHGIDLIVKDGDRELKVSYAKSTLDLRREDQSLQAQVAQGGDSMIRVGASTTTADGKAEGMIINAKGFSADEVEAVLDQLNKMSSGKAGGSSGGLAVLTPEKKADGILKLQLDLSAILPSASSSAAATASPAPAAAAPPASAGLNITA